MMNSQTASKTRCCPNMQRTYQNHNASGHSSKCQFTKKSF